MLSLPRRGVNAARLPFRAVAAAVVMPLAFSMRAQPARAAVSGQLTVRPAWAHVTSAGNAPYTYSLPGLGERTIGRVYSDFYIRTTEVTGGEWFEFVNAVKPYMTTNLRLGSAFLGGYIRWDLFSDGSVTYLLDEPGIARPVDVSWRYAAMYCNWLHNNKESSLSSFLSGAYTLDGTTNNSLPFAPREAGARYWLPSEDEWVKASYFDPKRSGPNQPGYWQYPNGTDVSLIPGQPGTGAHTSGGVLLSFEFSLHPEVGAYPNTLSPWGLLDVSGGWREWTDTAAYSGGTAGEWYGYLQRGSRYGDLDITHYTDHLEWYSYSGSFASTNGIRLASSVPCVGATSVFFTAVALTLVRRRKATP